MPYYQKIKANTKEGDRTIRRLLALRKELKKQIPPRTLHETLLLATWNIRDFDKPSYGDRMNEAIYYRDTEEDKAVYMEYMDDYEIKPDGKPRSEVSKKNYYQTYWRTHQMSDHLPMWVELKIDYSDEYLQRKLDR